MSERIDAIDRAINYYQSEVDCKIKYLYFLEDEIRKVQSQYDKQCANHLEDFIENTEIIDSEEEEYEKEYEKVDPFVPDLEFLASQISKFFKSGRETISDIIVARKTIKNLLLDKEKELEFERLTLKNIEKYTSEFFSNEGGWH